jgi:ClpP class serine protease
VVTDSGIGILPIYGALAQRAGEITPDCTEMTSYQRLGRTFDAMVADPDVRAILLEVDSPGGQVAGNFELGRKIVAARDTKPVWAHANEIAFSGGTPSRRPRSASTCPTRGTWAPSA